MSLPLFVVRPEPGWSATMAAARSFGLQVLGEPLSVIEPLDWEVPEDRFDGLLVGSANVFRHGGVALETLRHIPVHCVGETTAKTARNAGFVVHTVEIGGLGAVLDALKGRQIRLLRLCGRARVALDTPPGIGIVERIVYRAQPLPIDRKLAAKLAGGGVVALHSGELARHFAAECARLSLPRARLELVLIGQRLQGLAGAGWRAVHTAPRPDDAALLALAAQVCSKAG